MKFPAGKYYVGDLSYVLTRREWQEVCAFRDEDGFLKMNSGKKLWFAGTAYGDGTYKAVEHGQSDPATGLTKEFNVGVDTGTIGIIAVRHTQKKALDWTVEKKKLAGIVEMKEPFIPSKNGSIFSIGHVTIDTDPRDEEED